MPLFTSRETKVDVFVDTPKLVSAAREENKTGFTAALTAEWRARISGRPFSEIEQQGFHNGKGELLITFLYRQVRIATVTVLISPELGNEALPTGVLSRHSDFQMDDGQLVLSTALTL
jgi:hypothetical protein